MRAAITPVYGPAHVLQSREVPVPVAGAHDVLVQVRATTVTAGDLRLRAADFPSITALLGRLMLGWRRPKKPIQGTIFAGRVVAVGSAITRYAVGDDVFGTTNDGTYAEYLAMPEEAAMTRMPPRIGYEEAVAIPYGAITALRFLQDLASVRSGEQVLIVGASGGVGRFAVQLAKHLGAEVTAVCAGRNADLVRSLGADHVVDHERDDFTQTGDRYDVVFDTAGVTTFGRCRRILPRDGHYLTLFISVGVLVRMALASLGRGPKVTWAIAFPRKVDMERVRKLVEQDVFRPVLGPRFALEDIAEAHVVAETRRVAGSVIVTVATPQTSP